MQPDQKLITYARERKNIVNQLFTVQETVLQTTKDGGRTLKCPECKEDFYTEEDNRIFRSDKHDIWIEKYPMRCKDCGNERQYFDIEVYMAEQDILDVEKRKLYSKIQGKAYREKNPVFVKRIQKEWFAKHPNYQREYRANNPEIYEAQKVKAKATHVLRLRTEADYREHHALKNKKGLARKKVKLANDPVYRKRVNLGQRRSYARRKEAKLLDAIKFKGLQEQQSKGISVEADLSSIEFPTEFPEHLIRLSIAATVFRGDW